MLAANMVSEQAVLRSNKAFQPKTCCHALVRNSHPSMFWSLRSGVECLLQSNATGSLGSESTHSLNLAAVVRRRLSTNDRSATVSGQSSADG